MAQKIKAIETKYRGYRFRSRLEARWAVFFDALGIKWEYEPEGYVLSDGSCYLPDFYLPDADRWVEIKGKPLRVAELKKCEQFCLDKDEENIKFSIFIGAPEPIEIPGISMALIPGYRYQWPVGNLMLEDGSISDLLIFHGLQECPAGLCRENILTHFIASFWGDAKYKVTDIKLAAEKAKSARFEYGGKG